jgi:hypothetical protein
MPIGENRPYTNLDFQQVIKQVFNENEDRLRVDAVATIITPPEIAVSISDTEDSIRIGNGAGNLLAVNADGSINVNVITTVLPIVAVNTYNEVTTLPIGASTTLVSYTVPIGKSSYLQTIEASGGNVAVYSVKINGVTIAKDYCGRAADFTASFKFETGIPSFPGLKYAAGTAITVVVVNAGTTIADFDARIQVIEEG